MTTSATIRRAVYLLPGIVILLTLLATSAERFATMRNDFLQFYVSAQLLGTPDYYNEAANRALSEAVAPNAGVKGFPCRPPFQTMLLWPLLRWLPLYWAFVLFEIIAAGSLIFFTIRFTGRNPALPVLASLSVPVAICLINGQDTFLVLLFAGLGVLLVERGRHWAAGVALSLCAIKFHIFLLLPAMLLLQRRWKTAGGFAVGSAGLLLASFAVQGWRWPLELLAVVSRPELNPFVELMPNLHGLWRRLGAESIAPVAASSILAAGMALAASRGSDFGRGLSAVVVGGMLISYHAYLYDPVLLLIPLALLPGQKIWIALTAPPLYWLAVLDGPAGTVGIVGMVAVMMAALTALAFPQLYQLLEQRTWLRANPKPC